MDDVLEFYVLAIVVGLVQGGVQSISRSFYARIIPRTRSAEFFGFYNMLGTFAVVIGPLLIALVSSFSGDPRATVWPIIILFVIGGVLLLLVDEKEGQRVAQAME